MALTLESIKKKIRTSIHGRRLGLSHDDYLCGPKDTIRPVTNATSATTATALLPYGVHTVATSTNDTWTLTDPPHAGLTVVIYNQGTSTGASTGICTISPAAATIVSSNGVAGDTITMDGIGDRIVLHSLSTAQWAAFPSDATVVSS